MVAEREVWWLTEDELERFREIEADIAGAENTSMYSADDRQLVRSLYFSRWLLLSEVYERAGLDRTRTLTINPATGSIVYEPYDVMLETE